MATGIMKRPHWFIEDMYLEDMPLFSEGSNVTHLRLVAHGFDERFGFLDRPISCQQLYRARRMTIFPLFALIIS